MSVVRVAYLGILAASLAWSVLSAVLLVVVVEDEDRGGACFWASCFALASLIADLAFWGAV